jgi:uncharacterized protein (TIGR02996 family)
MTNRQSLEEQINKNPQDLDLRLVYADCLEELGDPEAAGVRLWVANERLKRAERLQQEAAGLHRAAHALELQAREHGRWATERRLQKEREAKQKAREAAEKHAEQAREASWKAFVFALLAGGWVLDLFLWFLMFRTGGWWCCGSPFLLLGTWVLFGLTLNCDEYV